MGIIWLKMSIFWEIFIWNISTKSIWPWYFTNTISTKPIWPWYLPIQYRKTDIIRDIIGSDQYETNTKKNGRKLDDSRDFDIIAILLCTSLDAFKISTFQPICIHSVLRTNLDNLKCLYGHLLHSGKFLNIINFINISNLWDVSFFKL